MGEALRALREGRPVLVTDDVYRENEGDVVLAAETLTPRWLGWTIRHSSGYVCAPMPEEWADRLGLPLMVADNEDPLRTAYTVTVDAADGIGTGISAADRTRTIRVLGDPASGRDDLIRPGHVVPLRARAGGVLERAGHTEAAVDLCRLAGLTPVAAIAELVDDQGEMLRGPQVRELAEEHGLPVLTIVELSAWRLRHDRVERVATTRLPTDHGTFRAVGYRDVQTGAEHVALIADGPDGDGRVPVVRVHSECLTGDTLGSRRCDCGPQLHHALARVGREGGVVVYLRGHEGRGVGLLDKLRAYAVQDTGADTVDAQHALGLPVDAREYGAASAILRDLGVDRVRLVTHNPAKVAAMVDGGIEVVEVLPSEVAAPLEAVGYLRAKRERLGHATLPEHRDAAGDGPPVPAADPTSYVTQESRRTS
nr:3,4-dihydroxy-2-butanone-4-phosphate synthase [Ornithinicoccus halotolerans]